MPELILNSPGEGQDIHDSSLRVGEVGMADDSAWQAFVQSHPEATSYHALPWRELVEQVFGLETHYLQATDAVGRVRGVLPLVRQKSRYFGDYLTSMPFFNYGGICASDSRPARALLEAAQALGEKLNVRHIELRHVQNQFPELPCRTDKVSMILKLPQTPDELRSNLKAKVRAQIKRPEREGIRVTTGGIDLIEDFYRVFAHNMRDLGTPVYPLRFFKAILTAFPDQVNIFLAKLQGRVVAGGLVFSHGTRLEIPWAASLRSANKLGVNMYLYWSILHWAIESGYQQFDFGRCTAGSGTFRFKKQWGAEPLQLHWHYLLYGDREIPKLNHDNPRYQALIRLWQRQPVALANLIGPRLAKFLP